MTGRSATALQARIAAVRLLREHHGLHREAVHPRRGKGMGLFPERREVLLVGGHVLADPVVERQVAGGPDGAGHEAAGRAGRAGQPHALLVQLAGARAHVVPHALVVLVQLERGAAEGVGLDEVRARVEVALVDPAHHVRVRVVPELRAVAVAEARVEERGAVAAVEDQALAGAEALHDLPAARAGRHHAFTGTPSSSLARTTAMVESLRVAVGADLVGVGLVHGRPSDHDLHPIAQPRLLERVDGALHRGHRGGHQRGDADDVGLVLLHRGHELLGGHVPAQVDRP